MSIVQSIDVVDARGALVTRLDGDGVKDRNGNVYTVMRMITWPLTVGTVDSYIYTNFETQEIYRIAAVGAMVSTVGGAGAAVTVVHCPSVAIAAGTPQLTVPLDLTVTAPSKVKGILITSLNDILPGDSLAIDVNGTLTGLVGALTVVMRRMR